MAVRHRPQPDVERGPWHAPEVRRGAAPHIVRPDATDATDPNGTGAQPVISNADLRGRVASMIVTRGDQQLNYVVG
ncbi:hypothetical protein [Streptomyces sp. NPDC002276]